MHSAHRHEKMTQFGMFRMLEPACRKKGCFKTSLRLQEIQSVVKVFSLQYIGIDSAVEPRFSNSLQK